jgi:hypothetical protein
MDKYSKKCVFLGGIQKLVMDVLLKFPKFFEAMAGIIKITKTIEDNGPKKKNRLVSHNKVV